MSISKSIAQARIYETAMSVLTIQIAILAIGIGVQTSSWWKGILAFILIVMFACFRWTRLPILILLSAVWSRLFYEIGQATDVGLWSYLIALVAFTISYGYNWTGAIGLSHTVPEYE